MSNPANSFFSAFFSADNFPFSFFSFLISFNNSSIFKWKNVEFNHYSQPPPHMNHITAKELPTSCDIIVQLLKQPFSYSNLFLRIGPAYSQVLWKISGSASWIIWICQILRMWDYFILQSTKHTLHTLITFFWLMRGTLQPLLIAHFLKITPTLYDLIHLFSMLWSGRRSHLKFWIYLCEEESTEISTVQVCPMF